MRSALIKYALFAWRQAVGKEVCAQRSTWLVSPTLRTMFPCFPSPPACNKCFSFAAFPQAYERIRKQESVAHIKNIGIIKSNPSEIRYKKNAEPEEIVMKSSETPRLSRRSFLLGLAAVFGAVAAPAVLAPTEAEAAPHHHPAPPPPPPPPPHHHRRPHHPHPKPHRHTQPRPDHRPRPHHNPPHRP